MKLPQANTAVANSTSNGTSRSKKAAGVASSRSAPTTPPARLITTSARKESAPTPETSCRAGERGRDLAREQRDRGGDVGRARIHAGEQQRRQGQERPAPRERVLDAGKQRGDGEEDQHAPPLYIPRPYTGEPGRA